jgi:hypothetical protein
MIKGIPKGKKGWEVTESEMQRYEREGNHPDYIAQQKILELEEGGKVDVNAS